MDRAKKFLKKLSSAQRNEIDDVLLRIERGTIEGLDLKKLKGHRNLFRVRVGNLRIVFSKDKDTIRILFVGKRGDSKYDTF